MTLMTTDAAAIMMTMTMTHEDGHVAGDDNSNDGNHHYHPFWGDDIAHIMVTNDIAPMMITMTLT
jgi:hypothetical protein